MRRSLQRGYAALVSASLIAPPGFAQTEPPLAAPAAAPAASAAPAADNAAQFNPEQLDALAAPIALYPDPLLMQVLMASTYPLQIVDASRWLASGNNKSLTGDALASAVDKLSWDPSVKSLVPFPQVLETMDQKLDWTQQLGYAVATQQQDVMDSVQRLRRQAQEAGTLKTTPQQTVTTVAMVSAEGAPAPEAPAPQQAIVIQPTDPQVVYVPSYNPTEVYGTWPYPATPPVYLPPPPGYAVGTALASGIAFAAGAAVVGSLWGWATPRWGGYGRYGCCGGGSINVNANRYNHLSVNNVNRANFQGNRWQASVNRPGSPALRPVSGPVGAPRTAHGLSANAIGRPSVKVPAQAVNRPNIGAGAAGGLNRANAGVRATRLNLGQRAGGAGVNRANVPAGANRPNLGQGAGRPGGAQAGGALATRPAPTRVASARPSGGAFGGINDGARAAQFQQRGAQSIGQHRQTRSAPPVRAASFQGGGGHGGGGRGGGRVGGRHG